jgi:hypothetical protein
MKDIFDFTSPLGPLGHLADALFLEKYMRRLFEESNAIIRQIAEAL